MVTKDTNHTQSTINSRVWRTGSYLRSYDNRVLNLPEVYIFVRYASSLSGRVLDLGCGAGRVLEYLVMLGADAHGLDISPVMVEHCRRTVPQATVAVGDLATLSTHVDGKFNAVLAPDNLLDVFNDTERRDVIAQIREVLEPDGLFIFSSHDLASLDGPSTGAGTSASTSAGGDARITLEKLLHRSIGELGRSAVGRVHAIGNRRRLAPLQQRHSDHAIINDRSHHYSLLHYYIRREDQERQLNELGFDLVECLDMEGRPAGQGVGGPGGWLYYIARRS